MTPGRVLVAGATGVMGRRILGLVPRWLAGAEVVAGSRRPPATGAVDVPWERLDLSDIPARALHDVDVLINAVGPYMYDPGAVIAACHEVGCDYVDLAEVPAFLDRARAAARADGPRVVTGASTVPGLIEVLAQNWANEPRVASLDVLLGIGSRNDVSSALVFSLLRPLGSKAPDGSPYYRELTWWEPPGVPPRLYGRYPAAFDGEGLLLGARALPTRFWFGCDRPLWTRLLHYAAPLVPRLGERSLRAVSRAALLGVPFAKAVGSATGTLSLVARDLSGAVFDTVEVAAQHDGLDIPALPSVWAARRLLDPPADLPKGAVTLPRMFGVDEVVRWLREAGFEVRSALKAAAEAPT